MPHRVFELNAPIGLNSLRLWNKEWWDLLYLKTLLFEASLLFYHSKCPPGSWEHFYKGGVQKSPVYGKAALQRREVSETKATHLKYSKNRHKYY